MRFSLRERVTLAGLPGCICAVVRRDDDPRKCVPSGERMVLRGDLPERDEETYLVKMDRGRLRWSYRRKLLPLLPAPGRPFGSPRGSVVPDAQSISDGTLACITGLTDTASLRAAAHQFVQFVIGAESNGVRYGSWIDAWRWFVNGSFGDTMPAYDADDRKYLRVRCDAAPANGLVWASPDGSSWISCDEAPMTYEDLRGLGLLGDPERQVIRAGFVRRHWLAGRQADAFAAWLSGTQTAKAA